MAVVRELVTRLGFQVDRQGIDRFNTSILGFKAKFAIASAAVGGFLNQVLGAVSATSDLVADTQDLSRATGIAFNQLYSLGEAARQFRIEPKQFQGALKALSSSIQDARYGFGKLFDLIKQRPDIQIFNDDGTLKSTLNILDQIIKSVNKIDDAQERIRIFENIFGLDGARLEDLFSNGVQGLKDLSAQFQLTGSQLESQTQTLREYRENVNALTTAWNNFTINLVNNVAPTLTTLLGLISKVVNAFTYVTNAVVSGAKTGFQLIGEGLNADLRDFDDPGYLRSLQGTPAMAGPELTVTNNFDISVPPGTLQEQTAYIQNNIGNQLQNFFDKMTRELINNNPQVE